MERFVIEKEKVVVDQETGLMWQRSASPDKFVWKEGFAYIDRLNAENYAGFSDWRYPTKEELGTLILPEEDRRSGLYISPSFEKQRNCWSSTQADGHGHQACYADFYYGDLYLVEENYANYFVRAVRSHSAD